MDVGGIRKFLARRSPRSLGLGVAACVLLAVPIAWAVRQARLTHEALARAAAAESAAAKARRDAEAARRAQPPKDPAVRRSRHDDPGEIARVKQLYEEIEDLARRQEQVEDALGRHPRIRLRHGAKGAGRGARARAAGSRDRLLGADPVPRLLETPQLLGSRPPPRPAAPLRVNRPSFTADSALPCISA